MGGASGVGGASFAEGALDVGGANPAGGARDVGGAKDDRGAWRLAGASLPTWHASSMFSMLTHAWTSWKSSVAS